MIYQKQKGFVKRTLSLVLSATMLLGTVLFCGDAPVTAAELTDATVQSYEAQIAALAKKAEETLSLITSLRKEEASWQEQKAMIDSYLNIVQRKIDAAEILQMELESQIALANTQISETQAEYDVAYEKFLEHIAITYEEGNASLLDLILGAKSLSDFLSRIERVNSMLEYRKSIMDALTDKKAELTAIRADLDEKKQIQEDVLAQLSEDKMSYETQANAAIAQLATLQRNEEEALKIYYANKAEEEKLDKELEEYLKELQRKNQAALEGGEWMWPLPMNTYQRNTSAYGWRYWDNPGVWEFHYGWDFGAYAGTDIYAAKGGKVIISTFHKSYGNYVVIDHGGGVSTVYAHASKLLVKVGDVVKKGDVIAKVGTTGNSNGNHLHFEFRKDGKHTDPFQYIPNPPITVKPSKFTKG